MKKNIKITIIILLTIIIILIIDTFQGRILNNKIIFKITEEYNETQLLKKDKGILINRYYCKNGEEKTLFKWEKFLCMDTNYGNSYNINDEEYACRDVITGEVNLEELEEINSKIKNFVETSDISKRKNLSTWTVDKENGIVKVGLIDNSLEQQELFKKNIGVYKCIVFSQEGPFYH